MPENADSPILVTVAGIVIDTSFVLAKARLSMVVRVTGRLIAVIPVLPSNALAPIDFKVESAAKLTVLSCVSPLKAPAPIDCSAGPKVTLCSPEQPTKASVPIVCSVFGNVMLDILLQPLNAPSPMEVRSELAAFAKVTRVKLEHPEKAFAFIFVTLEGMITCVKCFAFWKAPAAIVVTELGISYVALSLFSGYLISVVLSLLNNTPSPLSLNASLLSSTIISVKAVQPSNNLSPRASKLAGIVTLVNEVQFKNACKPRVDTEEAIVI